MQCQTSGVVPLHRSIAYRYALLAQVNSSQESPSTYPNTRTSGSPPLTSAAAVSQQAQPTPSRHKGNGTSNGRSTEQVIASSRQAIGIPQATATSDIVEGWVSNNLDTFVNEPAEAVPGLTANGTSSNGSASKLNNLQSGTLQQQQPQQQHAAQRRQQTVNGSGEAESRQQQRQFGSGGAWATVDDEMERARQLLSPWRYINVC